jgi:hypothetical protein
MAAGSRSGMENAGPFRKAFPNSVHATAIGNLRLSRALGTWDDDELFSNAFSKGRNRAHSRSLGRVQWWGTLRLLSLRRR